MDFIHSAILGRGSGQHRLHRHTFLDRSSKSHTQCAILYILGVARSDLSRQGIPRFRSAHRNYSCRKARGVNARGLTGGMDGGQGDVAAATAPPSSIFRGPPPGRSRIGTSWSCPFLDFQRKPMGRPSAFASSQSVRGRCRFALRPRIGAVAVQGRIEHADAELVWRLGGRFLLAPSRHGPCCHPARRPLIQAIRSPGSAADSRLIGAHPAGLR